MIKIGNKNVKDIRIGDKKVTKAFIGDRVIFNKGVNLAIPNTEPIELLNYKSIEIVPPNFVKEYEAILEMFGKEKPDNAIFGNIGTTYRIVNLKNHVHLVGISYDGNPISRDYLEDKKIYDLTIQGENKGYTIRAHNREPISVLIYEIIE